MSTNSPAVKFHFPEITFCSNPTCKTKLKIVKVIFNNPATIVIWSDGTKTVVKCQPGDVYDQEKGLLLCIAKKHFGNKGDFNEVLKKFIPEELLSMEELPSLEEIKDALYMVCHNSSCDSTCLFWDKGDCRNFEDMTDDVLRDAYIKALKGGLIQ